MGMQSAQLLFHIMCVYEYNKAPPIGYYCTLNFLYTFWLIATDADNESDIIISFFFSLQLAETYNCLFIEASSRAPKNCSKVY